jgi:(R,R)-butanediol dehydrogenase / meso-butanediol dehydrogenase / diacetyl reductase
MLTAQYIAGQGIEVGSRVEQPPAPGEVQIRVAYTGICGTDLHIARGHMDARTGSRMVIGHEMSGTVAASSGTAEEWPVGTPVTVMPLLWCGECATCLAGHEHICENLTFVGIDAPGALQELWNVPERIVVRLPRALALRDAALVEPVAVAHHDVERGAVAATDAVVVVGGGPVGVLIALVAHHRGARVVVIEPDSFRREVIQSVGLTAVDPSDIDAAELVSGTNHGAGADVAFEVSGTQPGLTTAVAVLRPRGRLVVVGIHAQPREIDAKAIFWRELEIRGARVYERSDYDAAIALLSSGAIPTAELISEVVPLSAAPDAFAALERGGAVMKVLVEVSAGGDAP